MDKVTFEFSHGGRVVHIHNAGIHQKALMLEYFITENDCAFNRSTLHPIKVAANSYFAMHRFISFLFDNTDPNDYDETALAFIQNTKPHLIK